MKNNKKKKIMAYWKKREIEEALFDRRIRQYTVFFTWKTDHEGSEFCNTDGLDETFVK